MNDRVAAGNESSAIDYSSGNLPGPLVRWKDATALRAREKMFAHFRRVMPTDSATRVLDVGVTPEQSITSNNFFEALYPWKNRITATSIEDASFLETEYPGLRFVRTDGVSLPFDDDEFDVVFSSAVLEHVGPRDHQQRFVDELLRVGKRYFATTPNRWFPVDLHTGLPVIHWMPQSIHQAALRGLGMDFWASTDNLNLLSAAAFVDLFPPEASVELIKFRTAGMTSNLIAHGPSV
jgi:SAM-dependent methyltransferase